MDKKEIILDLVEKLNMYSEYYYTFDNPLISDKEWDEMYDRLLTLEEETGIVLSNSPTKKVGGEVLKGFKKVKHSQKLFSLDKCNNYGKLGDWMADLQCKFGVENFTLEYKYDGLRIVAKYKNGKLISAATRGNGIVGEDVTAQVKTIKTLPNTIGYLGNLVVTGEVVMRRSVFKNYNATATETLKNERNAAAGAVRNLDTSITASRKLDAIIYDILEVDDEVQTQSGVNEFLSRLGFFTWEKVKVVKNIGEVTKIIDSVESEKNTLDVLIDGMVLKVNDISVRNKIGHTNKFPKWAIAFKFEAEEVSTTLLGVVWQVGRTGKITPVALLDEVELAGASVTRATLNNYNDILRKDVKINSAVFVRRSNEVIPEVLSVASHFENSLDIEMPKICPACGHNLEVVGANLFCHNSADCKPQIVGRIVHYCSRNTMNIEGVSEKTVYALIDKLSVKTVADLYDITHDVLLTLDGFKNKKAQNFINSVEKSKNCNLAQFIFSLSIEGVGDKTATDLAKQFKTFDNLKNATYDELIEVENIGEVVAESIIDYFSNAENLSILNALFDRGISIKNEQSETVYSEHFTGKTVVITGTFSSLTRHDATKLLQNMNAKVAGSVSAKTDVVIVGENAGSKFDDAMQLGIKTINEAEFLTLINK